MEKLIRITAVGGDFDDEGYIETKEIDGIDGLVDVVWSSGTPIEIMRQLMRKMVDANFDLSSILEVIPASNQFQDSNDEQVYIATNLYHAGKTVDYWRQQQLISGQAFFVRQVELTKESNPTLYKKIEAGKKELAKKNKADEAAKAKRAEKNVARKLKAAEKLLKEAGKKVVDATAS